MKLKRFLLRYYPPGIILEYVRSNGEQETKSIDLLNLSAESTHIHSHSPNDSQIPIFYFLFWRVRMGSVRKSGSTGKGKEVGGKRSKPPY